MRVIVRQFCTCGDRIMCSLRLHLDTKSTRIGYTPTKQWITCGEVRKCVQEYKSENTKDK